MSVCIGVWAQDVEVRSGTQARRRVDWTRSSRRCVFVLSVSLSGSKVHAELIAINSATVRCSIIRVVYSTVQRAESRDRVECVLRKCWSKVPSSELASYQTPIDRCGAPSNERDTSSRVRVAYGIPIT